VKKRDQDNLRHLSMQDLFRVEAENQAAVLTGGLLELERAPASAEQLESLMRAAHSFKGAARIVNLSPAVHVAHALEDCFVAAQHGRITLQQDHVDVLLRGVDWLTEIAKQSEQSIAAWHQTNEAKLETWLGKIRAFTPPRPSQDVAPVRLETTAPAGDTALYKSADIKPAVEIKTAEPDRFLRLTAENLNRLLALAGESLVESRWLRPFSESMQRLKRMQTDLESTLETLRHQCDGENLSEPTRARFHQLFGQVTDARHYLNERLQELDLYDRRSASLSNRLYLEVLRTRMRPFGDGVHRFPRMVRDLARSLGKQVRLEIHGETTQVDRDILDRLEAPLAHLIRNAVDHGCEMPDERARQGKPREATIRLEARHTAGMLQLIVADDGTGLDTRRVRDVIVARKLTTPAVAEKMTESELLQFLFLPGFTLRETVTEISGRGVGLDIVQNMVKSVRGSVRVSTLRGRGMRFQLQLPLTLSVLRTLLVEIGGEPYAFPLAQISSTLKLSRENIETLEGRHHFRLADQHVGLLAAHQVFACPDVKPPQAELPVVVLGERNQRYGLLVDRFLGERELVVQPLDPRLGKVKDISAAALMEDGAPVLIVDVDDMVRSIEKLVSSGELANVGHAALEAATQKRKRVLVVDDSLTVRELERKLLEGAGYSADVAVDGMDGWNAVRSGNYDLIITDVDMPRMDGIELASLIKKDDNFKALPVMIVSYKDREEDRMRGLNAGADYYLTKGSFHDETLIQAVVDLIGEADK
jgi:two-component system sensor histidine kinase and response regulator WspE